MNYEITPYTAVFGRIDQGVHFPGFDDLRSGEPETEGIKNYEVGYRVESDTLFYGVIDVFHRGIQFSAAPPHPVNRSPRPTALCPLA